MERARFGFGLAAAEGGKLRYVDRGGEWNRMWTSGNFFYFEYALYTVGCYG